MPGQREPVVRTLSIALAVALFCSTMVTASVYLLRPVQSAYAALERNRAILGVAGQLPADATEREVVLAYLDLEARVLDLDAGSFTTTLDARSYDHWQVAEGHSDPRRVPVYLVRKAGSLERLVLPVHGPGMWSTIYGYVALGPDLSTIAAAGFHRLGETPGVGDRIQDPAWLAQWRGKRIYDAGGAVRFRVGKPDADSRTEHRVDLITGASVTSEAVGSFVRDWFGPAGYGPWLAQLRESEAGWQP